MKIKSLKQIKSLKGKRVFLRVDFNVPLKEGKIKDDYKIKLVLSFNTKAINELVVKNENE